MTGRKVEAEECLRIGLCEKVVPRGEARKAAEAMAQEIARFPQACVRADRGRSTSSKAFLSEVRLSGSGGTVSVLSRWKGPQAPRALPRASGGMGILEASEKR